MAEDTGYEVNKYGYSTRPMSDDQAKSLLTRLKNTLEDRIMLSDDTERYPWRDDGQRESYLNKVTSKLNGSISNIDKDLKDGNIVAHEMSVAPEAIPSGEDPTKPNDIVNAKYIIKAMDGIAMINTILNINDIRNIYAKEPDGNLFANGLINNAIRGSNKVDETYPYNKDYKWGNLTPPYIKNYTTVYTSRVNNNTHSVKQSRLYPHFTKNTDDPFYNFSGLLYKYINVINMVAGDDSVNKVQDRVPNQTSYYWDRVAGDFHAVEYGFTFDPNFSSTIDYPSTQKQYIIDALNLISPIDGDEKAASVSADIVKYVQDFARDYINAKETKSHQPISSVFDYYVIDYIVQILEAEFEMFEELRFVYRWQSINNNTHTIDVSGPNIGKPNANRDTEILQLNDAPFYYSTCNGASCIGLCYGSCVNTCNGCGGCTGFCSTACGGTCISGCAGCTSGCSGECNTSCTGKCTTTCTKTCQSACKNGCSDGCSTSCTGECTGCKNTCNSGCNDNCVNGCKDRCEGSCGWECAGTSEAIPNTITNEPSKATPSHSEGRTWAATNPDTGISYIAATQGPYTGGQRIDVSQNSMNYSSDAYIANGYAIANGGSGRREGGSGTSYTSSGSGGFPYGQGGNNLVTPRR